MVAYNKQWREGGGLSGVTVLNGVYAVGVKNGKKASHIL